MNSDGYQETDSPALEEPHTDDETKTTAYETYRNNRSIVQPEPDVFERPEDRMCAKYVGRGIGFSSRKDPLNLRKDYRRLQITVKLANTPDAGKA